MAGTATKGNMKRGLLNGAYTGGVAYPVDFVADADDGSFIPVNLTDFNGWQTAVRVIFGTPAPDKIEIQVADEDGVDLLGGLGSGANAFTETGKITLSPPEQFHDKLIINLSGNTTNSAQVKVVVYVM